MGHLHPHGVRRLGRRRRRRGPAPGVPSVLHDLARRLGFGHFAGQAPLRIVGEEPPGAPRAAVATLFNLAPLPVVEEPLRQAALVPDGHAPDRVVNQTVFILHAPVFVGVVQQSLFAPFAVVDRHVVPHGAARAGPSRRGELRVEPLSALTDAHPVVAALDRRGRRGSLG